MCKYRWIDIVHKKSGCIMTSYLAKEYTEDEALDEFVKEYGHAKRNDFTTRMSGRICVRKTQRYGTR